VVFVRWAVGVPFGRLNLVCYFVHQDGVAPQEAAVASQTELRAETSCFSSVSKKIAHSWPWQGLTFRQ
jgi:hypothetical protein